MVETTAAMFNCVLTAFGMPTCLISSAIIAIAALLAPFALDSIGADMFDWATYLSNFLRLGK